MNLFVAIWNPSAEQRVALPLELRRMAEIYPQMDENTLWHRSEKSVVVGSMAHAMEVVQPRRLLAASEGEACFYDGSCVDSRFEFPAHDAAALGSYWEKLPRRLEGRYAAMRVQFEPCRLELLTDYLGLLQLYYQRSDRTWVVSNSVRLIQRLSGADSLDLTAASMMVSMAFIVGNRTLEEQVRVVPGGERWTWTENTPEPEVFSYAPRAALLQGLGDGDVDYDGLAEQLQSQCAALGDGGPLECPLTAGRDSRVLAALLRQGGVEARYYTDTLGFTTDVEYGRKIAAHLGVPYTVYTKTADDIRDAWSVTSKRLVQQTDGMVSLGGVQDMLESQQVDHLPVRLWGLGGEMARGFYFTPDLLMGRPTSQQIKDYLAGKLINLQRGLVRPQAAETTRNFLHDFLDRTEGLGFSPLDSLDVFYAYGRTRRWFGSSARKVTALFDIVAPMCTGPFIEAAFRLPPRARYAETVHYEILRRLAPDLHGMPFDRGPWRTQSPRLQAVKWKLKAQMKRLPYRIRRLFLPRLQVNPSLWLEAHVEEIRTNCLEQGDSPLWDLVNKKHFEKLTAPKTPADQRNPAGILIIAALFYHKYIVN